MKQRSLTGRLIGSVLLAEMVCALVFSTVSVLHERTTRQHAFDLALKGRADSLLGVVQDAENPLNDVMVDANELQIPDEDRFEVLVQNGHVIGHSVPDEPLLLSLGRKRKDGYFNFRSHGLRYRALWASGARIIDRGEGGVGQRVPVTLLYAAPTNHMWHQVMEAVRFYVILSAILLGVTAFLLAWLLRQGLSPLRELAARASQVSTSNWTFDPPAESLDTPELAPITVAIRDLLSNLQLGFQRERQFTGDAAHELKTSIAILKSSLQLLSMRPRTPGEYRAGLDGLLTDIERMEDLITRMLTLTRIRETMAEPSSPIDVSQVLRQLLYRFSALAKTRQTLLRLDGPDSCAAYIEEEDVEILCSNLVMNSLQHSPPNGLVHITLSVLEDALTFSVCDDGSGIPPEALPHVFERFFRADISRSRKSGGAGLGLATCKAIVDRYNGSILIEPISQGGTRVLISLPAVVHRVEATLVFSQS